MGSESTECGAGLQIRPRAPARNWARDDEELAAVGLGALPGARHAHHAAVPHNDVMYNYIVLSLAADGRVGSVRDALATRGGGFGAEASFRDDLGIHYRRVQSEGSAVDGGSITL